MQNFVDSWNAKDLNAFCDLFHPDAEFTDVVNQTAIGIEAIRKQHEFAFNVVMKDASFEMSNLLLREFLPHQVLVSANWLNKNSQTPTGKMLPDRNGVLQIIIIKKEEQADWKIKLVHNSDFALPYDSRDGFIS